MSPRRAPLQLEVLDHGRPRTERAFLEKVVRAADLPGGGIEFQALFGFNEASFSLTRLGAVRSGDWKLLVNTSGSTVSPVALFDLATDPAEWSDELKAAILELRPDNAIEEIAAGIRQRQERALREKTETDQIEALKKGVIERAMYEPPEQWSDELKAAVVHLGWDLEEFTEGIRRRQAQRDANEESRPSDKGEPSLEDFGRRIRAAVEAGDLTPEEGREKLAAARLRDFQRGVIQRAMHEAPEKWSGRLKEAISRAGWDLAEFTEGIRQRQAAAAAGTDVNAVELNSLFQLDTAIESSTWGQVKEESRPEE